MPSPRSDFSAGETGHVAEHNRLNNMSNLHVGPDNPVFDGPGLWIETAEDGTISFWIEDGV